MLALELGITAPLTLSVAKSTISSVITESQVSPPSRATGTVFGQVSLLKVSPQRNSSPSASLLLRARSPRLEWWKRLSIACLKNIRFERCLWAKDQPMSALHLRSIYCSDTLSNLAYSMRVVDTLTNRAPCPITR